MNGAKFSNTGLKNIPKRYAKDKMTEKGTKLAKCTSTEFHIGYGIY